MTFLKNLCVCNHLLLSPLINLEHARLHFISVCAYCASKGGDASLLTIIRNICDKEESM
jgi:hypothetical protein